MARGTTCPDHRHRTPVPLHDHHLRPLSRGGGNEPGNVARGCANFHGNVHYLLDAIEDTAHPLIGSGRTAFQVWQAVPAAVKGTYSPTVRKYALDGWRRYGAQFLRGQWRDAYARTLTSGEPRTGGKIAGADDGTPTP